MNYHKHIDEQMADIKQMFGDALTENQYKYIRASMSVACANAVLDETTSNRDFCNKLFGTAEVEA